MGRAPCCEKVGLKKGRWTAEEDEILVNYIKANGEGSWRSLPKNAGLLRCGKSCRLRWINYLRADLKRGNISEEEEETIIKLHASVGNRWSLIAAHLAGRTDNEIKNYWNSHLSRRIHRFTTADVNGSAVIVDLGKIIGMSCKRRDGRTTRSAMKENSTSVLVPKNRRPPPPNPGPSETKGNGGGSMKTTGDPPSGAPVSELARAQEAQNGSMLAHEASLGSDQLFDPDQLQLPCEFWEATKAMASELFSPADGMGGEFWASKENSGGWGSTVEGEMSGGWSAVSSLSEERGECGATMSDSSSPNEEREAAGPTPASREEGNRRGAAAERVEAATATEHAHAEVEECNSTLTGERWTDMELEEVAAKLWDEPGEAWPWQWEETDLRRQFIDCCVNEEVPLHSWFLPDSL